MKPIALVACILMAFGSAGRVMPAHAGELVVLTEHGRINWSAHFVEAEGIGEPSPDGIKTPRGQEQSFRNAGRQAYRNLLKTVLGLYLTSGFTIEQYVANKDEVLSRIESLLHMAEKDTIRYLSDGTVEMTKKMPLTEAFSQLVLPETVIQLEIKKMGAEIPKETEKIYTGLVVDARGLPLMPALCFKVFDESGQEVYGPAYVSRAQAVQSGMCSYMTGTADAIEIREKMNQRVGRNPLIVRGLKTDQSGGGSNIFISNRDAARLRGSVDHLFFLRKCGVAVIIDPVEPEASTHPE